MDRGAWGDRPWDRKESDMTELLTQFPWWLGSKESACSAGNVALIPGLERSHRGGNGNPLQYSCWVNSTARGIWQATIHRVTKSWTQLSN